MDPLSLIVAALAAGAAAAAKDTAGAAIRDGYQGLKALIRKRLAADPAASVVLQEHEKDPDTYDAPLRKKLAAAALEQDQEILLAARQVLEQSTPSVGAAPVMIHQTISNVKYAATSGSGDASIGPIHEQPPGHG
jgi:hypothetical protein